MFPMIDIFSDLRLEIRDLLDIYLTSISNHRRRQDFDSGNTFGVGLVGGPGGGAPPPDSGEFAKIFKKKS